MKTYYFTIVISMILLGILVVGCEQQTTNAPTEDVEISHVEMANPFEDTAQTLIDAAIRWYNDPAKIPLLRKGKGDNYLELVNLEEWSDSLRKSPYFHQAFCDSLIPAILPDYYVSIMDYLYPISALQWMMKTEYSGSDAKYYFPFYGYLEISKMECGVPNSKGLARCAFKVEELRSGDGKYVAWLKRENGKWQIYQFLPEWTIH